MNLIKELLSLAQDLDSRNFTKEADVLDKAALILLDSSDDLEPSENRGCDSGSFC